MLKNCQEKPKSTFSPYCPDCSNRRIIDQLYIELGLRLFSKDMDGLKVDHFCQLIENYSNWLPHIEKNNEKEANDSGKL